ncbi:Hypothetical predicted protein [Mytilus galloprovincialis]|uniref:Uncharacterized protein n=1 Tax=Mytilus galloprovincialis TaxID=29158 RepID=A0A8B6E4H8_MYTGA|nr:Hypothetical predicted protein [Mytilus galloprovincialis]
MDCPKKLDSETKAIERHEGEKIMFGKQDVSERATVKTFEPCAPQDRTLDTYALRNLYDNLEEHAPNSSFFLYHDPTLAYEDENHDFADSMESTNVAMNTSVSATVHFEAFKCTEKALVPPKTLPIPLTQVNNAIQDDIEIDQSFIAKFVKHTTDHTLSEEQIQQEEQLTKGQSDNSFWKQIHRFKATPSIFGKIIKCSRNPDGILKAMFYSEPHSAALSYGKENEDKAIESYKQYMDSKGSNVQVESVGLILSKDRPGLGASLDGIVVDQSANITRGGLEWNKRR